MSKVENTWDKRDLSDLAQLMTTAENRQRIVAYGNKYGMRYSVEKGTTVTKFDDVEEAKEFTKERKKKEIK